MFKTRFFSILALLLMAVSGAWADETPLVTINSTGYTTFTSGSKTFDDKVTVTFSNSVSNDGDHWGWYADGGSLLTVAGTNGYTITSCKFYTFDGTAKTGYTVAGESPSVYLSNYKVYTDANQSVDLGKFGISKIEVYGGAAPATVDVTGVTLSQTSADMTVGGDALMLTATVAPDDATDKTVTWTTSDASVATVADGVVTAVGAGIATITATATNGTADTSDDKTATCEVTVSTATYSVALKDGTEDATSWTIAPAEATTTGVAAGTTVTATYSGTKKVKSVKAVKKAKPAATVTTAPTAKTGVKAGEDVAIVNEGTAEGGTMMYMVNATQPASTDGFSATVPTAEGLTAGTYYVWYYVKADDSHTDSEISASGIEVTIASAYTMAAAATSADKGKLICTDGHIHANGADAACTKARVAKIIYIGTTGHATYSHGLALALTDEGQMAWEAAKTACNTTKNTSTPVTGATWLLASKDQWDYMMGANGAGSDTALRNGFSGITGASNLQSSWYWSSTEYDADAFYAWDYNFDEEEWDWIEKYENDFVRACLAF